MAPYSAYVICTAPRSGSTLLCRLLAATGVAGNPGSHFHRPSLADWRSAYGLDVADLPEDAQRRAIFDAARAKGRGDTPVFGLRLQRHSFNFFIAQLRLAYPDGASDIACFDAAFGRTKFIHLTRANKVAQAVSRLKAEQTGLWHRAPDGTEIERLAPPAAPEYDAEAIAAHYATLTQYDADWRAWFATHHYAPLAVDYDALARDPQAALARVLDAIGQDPAIARTLETPVAKLADEVNIAWETRFRAERNLPV